MASYFEENIQIPVNSDCFESYVGRPPKDEAEFYDFVSLVKKGIDAQVDYGILYKCTAENFSSEIDEDKED